MLDGETGRAMVLDFGISAAYSSRRQSQGGGLRLTDEGRQRLHSPPAADASLEGRIGKLAHSEMRALERGFEILERLPR